MTDEIHGQGNDLADISDIRNNAGYTHTESGLLTVFQFLNPRFKLGYPLFGSELVGARCAGVRFEVVDKAGNVYEYGDCGKNQNKYIGSGYRFYISNIVCCKIKFKLIIY